METQNVEPVSTQPVEETTENDVAEIDYKSIADQAIAIAETTSQKLEQAEKDRDSYKKGMLAKDRKLKDLRDQGVEVDDEEKLTADKIEEIIDRKLQKAPEVATLTKTISELKTALVNRQGLPSSPAGNSGQGTEVKPNRWVDDPATKADLVARGLNPDKVWENWKALQP